MDTNIINEIIVERKAEQGGLISILETIQAKYGYLSRESLEQVSESTGRSLVDVYGVATFYKSFSLEPRGKHHVSACLGTACHVRGGPTIVEAFERELGVAAGKTTKDGEFSLETVNCLGACALGPIVVIDGQYFSNVRPEKIGRIVKNVRKGKGKLESEKDPRVFPLEVSCPRCNHDLMDRGHEIEGKPSIRVTISFERKHGWIRLSSLYGSFEIESEYPVPEAAVVNIFCPHCHGDLNGVPACAECAAPMVAMVVKRGGMLQICSRRGCRGHMLDLNGINL
ncbi:MAG: NADH-quinone oxidoreductase subunit NuoE family protein [Planctomycetota bacterium]|jgi:NADH-quinone oxidoreductase subunit E